MNHLPLARNRPNRKEVVKKQASEDSRTDAKVWQCVCPRCGELHEVEMFWTGRGRPRKFCSDCLDSEDYLYYIEPYRMLGNERRK